MSSNLFDNAERLDQLEQVELLAKHEPETSRPAQALAWAVVVLVIILGAAIAPALIIAAWKSLL